MKTRLTRAPALHDELYCKLVDQLYGTRGALLAAMFGVLTTAVAGVMLDGRAELYICLLILAVSAVTRGFILLAYRKSRHDRFDTSAVRRWELAYAVCAVLWMLAIGLESFYLMISPVEVLHLFSSIMAVGVTSGITGRNSSRPWIVNTQAAAVLIPFAIAIISVWSIPNLILATMIIFLILGVKSSAENFYNLLVSVMRTAQKVTFLANRFDTALNNMNHGLIMFDSLMYVEVVNRKFKELLGIEPEGLHPGSTISDILGGVPEQKAELALALKNYASAVDARARVQTDVSVVTNDGLTYDFRFHPMESGGTVIMIADVTEKKTAVARIERMAHYDDLTGLPNRATIRDFLTKKVLNLEAETKTPFSVLYLDLDHFKQVNDTLGHSVGDALLTLASARIKASIGLNDVCARLSGDEFVVVHFNDGDEEASARLAERLIQRVSAPYTIDNQELIVGLSVGIAVAGADGNTAEILLKNADLALYRAKEQGRGTFCFFLESMNIDARERREKELDLRRAIENDEIRVFYQPIVDLSFNRVACCEALVRWFHPIKGTIPPDEFIKMAEATGLIVALGDHVLRTACVEAMKWPSHICVAVNLSAVQFRRGAVIEQIRGALEISKLPAHRLEIEITESLALGNLPAVRQVIEQVRKLGVRVALDDFGTGYCSLSYLQQIPFDKIKIDKSFVSDLSEEGMSKQLIRLMKSFVTKLDKVLVVEGVETMEQVTILQQLGVQQMQGYVFCRPKPPAELGDLSAFSLGLQSQARMVA